MQAKTFSTIGLRLLAGLSIVRTINSVSLWAVEQHDTPSITINGGSLLLVSIPIILGIFLWIAAPKLSFLLMPEKQPEPAEENTLLSKEDFLTIGLIAIGILILINAISTVLLMSAEWLLT